MSEIETPVGKLKFNSSEDGNKFLQGKYYSINFVSVFFSIKISSESEIHEIDFKFIENIFREIDVYILKAKIYIEFIFKTTPKKLGCDESFSFPTGVAILDFPEITFWGGKKWSMLFSEGIFPICKPYGIIVNFSGENIVDFDDLSSADEV
jgi:hypothetical protein